ncbi:3-beta-hydroxysteroid-Delta(8),Delta(7)-isomerase [Aspergillus steynii IBT 23096]|uniref:3-beta-hydroxysteroid-Delta(8), Delta(7)-isomerase n=1 Tax=Aspergillus steynii IBT 23096 TaxID=1392250 RepID=A0A2I2FV65_9EURO|nr:3-beta-hydroxysteroid-Delta(8),Delta(7)-isomerase [Aspergillus steynii IBT 23096]PLB44501.1 3-beta-hydroxysteroid-Delta(8),Delta(7)-isomerase [Aspergillus steynii IBT 23096]
MAHPHSYYPVDAAIPNYVPNEWTTLSLVSTFAVACVVVLSVAKTLATNANPRISISELSTVLWFTLCCPIHLILEGYYALNWATLAGSQHLLAQLWKEYSLSDSRYLTSHAFNMVMENVTAWLWGPLSFLLAIFIVTENPFRHPLQIIISTGQLYGNILYYGTCAFDFLVHGVEYSRPEEYYFYGYFVFLNAFWIVIPIVLIFNSIRACAGSFAELKRLKARANGAAKKSS